MCNYCDIFTLLRFRTTSVYSQPFLRKSGRYTPFPYFYFLLRYTLKNRGPSLSDRQIVSHGSFLRTKSALNPRNFSVSLTACPCPLFTIHNTLF